MPVPEPEVDCVADRKVLRASYILCFDVPEATVIPASRLAELKLRSADEKSGKALQLVAVDSDGHFRRGVHAERYSELRRRQTVRAFDHRCLSHIRILSAHHQP